VRVRVQRADFRLRDSLRYVPVSCIRGTRRREKQGAEERVLLEGAAISGASLRFPGLILQLKASLPADCPLKFVNFVF